MNAPIDIRRAQGIEATGFRRVAVIGAGSMGGGIAAQFANAGMAVDLLDVAGPNASSLREPAQRGVERQLKSGGFMVAEAAELVRAGNVENDLERLREADWIVEAIIEDAQAKRDLYRRVDAVRKPDSFVSSNTSTILRRTLLEGMNDSFKKDLLITHFFNPPRVIRLVEIIAGPENPPERVETLKEACETILGKTVVDCKDTPGFIANRIGCYALAMAVIEGIRQNVEPEEVDAVMVALGMPRTGAYGLLDLIGIDLVPHVWGSLMNALPKSDAIQEYDLPAEPLIKAMIAEGRFGRKSGAGFYRKSPVQIRQTLDPKSGSYRDAIAFDARRLPGAGKDPSALLDDDGRLGRFAWSVFANLVAYTFAIAEEISHDPRDIDWAMVLGYGWMHGPMGMAARYGEERIRRRFAGENRVLAAIPARPRGAVVRGSRVGASKKVSLATLKGEHRPVVGSEAASLWDLGDGVACFEMHTKLNSFAPEVFGMLERTLERVRSDFAALVIGNEDARAFSVGADLRAFLGMIEKGDWEGLNAYIGRGQELFMRMKYAPFPVVAAAHGLALGGGCEFMLNANAIVAHAELNAGLPETRVGIIPGWGGGTQLLLRAASNPAVPKGPQAGAQATFDLIRKGSVSTSALEARMFGMLLPDDRIVMNRDHLLAQARSMAIEIAASYQVPARAVIPATGRPGYLSLMNGMRTLRNSGHATDTDMAIADVLATTLTGGNSAARAMSEEEMMQLEREGCIALARLDATRARIEHMLATNKPLRN